MKITWEDSRVVLDMTADQYKMLLIALGYATAHAMTNDPDLYPLWVALGNEFKKAYAAPDR